MKNGNKYFSMFTGVGGFELGFGKHNNSKSQSEKRRPQKRRDRPVAEQRSLLYGRSNSALRDKRFRCVGFSEIDKFAERVLKYRFPEITNYGDITKITDETIREIPDFDLLCGGFPCQAFSLAGKRKGFDDTRGTLFFEITRVLEIKKPPIVLLENVKGLLNHEKGETYRVILQTLAELGYSVQWMVLNSKFFGVPQNRERVFIVGSLRTSPRPEILPFRGKGKEAAKPVTEALAKNRRRSVRIVQLNKPNHSNNRVYSENGISPALNTAQGGNRQPKIKAVLTPDRPKKRQNGRRFKNVNEPMFTLTGQDKHGIMHDARIRRLTPIECERLQGFPDNWTKYGIDEEGHVVEMSDSQRYKQMGNAVTVNVINAIAEQLSNEFI